jgi:hypothetical protein
MSQAARNRAERRGASAAGGGGQKFGRRVNEWADAVGLCRATVYNRKSAGEIASVKSGSCRIITTSPSDFLTSLANAAT